MLLVEHDGLTSDPFKLIVRRDAISIFTYERVPGSGEFEPVVLHSDGATLVTPDNPARANEVVVLYATGFGQLINAPLTGTPALASPNDSLTDPLPTSIYSSNEGTTYGLWVHYSGLAAGYVGLWQLNIQMPDGPLAGDNAVLRVNAPNSFQSVKVAFEP